MDELRVLSDAADEHGARTFYDIGALALHMADIALRRKKREEIGVK